MFQLDITKKMAAGGFSPVVLSAIERDAFSMAVIRIQNANEEVTAEKVLAHANQLLPQNLSEGTRLFYATQHQIHDQEFDHVRDAANFIELRAEHLEERAGKELQDSKSLPGWIAVLAKLAESYSYVIEAALDLETNGRIAMRRSSQLMAITTRPDDSETNQFHRAQLFDKAMALFRQRELEVKPSLQQAYR